MGTMLFDTLKYARRLRDVGVPEAQAETQAELMSDALVTVIEDLATTDDLVSLGAELRTEIDVLAVRLESKMERLFAIQSVMLGIIMMAVVVPRLQGWFS